MQNNEIKKVLICGLGALGLTYAEALNNYCELKILADKERIENFRKHPPILNKKIVKLDYITPSDEYNPDLIIIATKNNGLESAINYIKNFVTPNCIIISLLNGISSEKRITETYPDSNVINSFYIGGSAIREKNEVTKLNGGKIIIPKSAEILEKFFKTCNIEYETTQDIFYAQWVKLGVNIVLNQLSAIYRQNVGQVKTNKDFLPLAKDLIKEIIMVAQTLNIKNFDNYEQDVLNSINLVANEGKTSMLQDVLAKRKTEVEIFSGEIINIAKKFNIQTPVNKMVYNKIKEVEESYLWTSLLYLLEAEVNQYL